MLLSLSLQFSQFLIAEVCLCQNWEPISTIDIEHTPEEMNFFDGCIVIFNLLSNIINIVEGFFTMLSCFLELIVGCG